jgi:hypothetical protein
VHRRAEQPPAAHPLGADEQVLARALADVLLAMSFRGGAVSGKPK